MILVTKLQNNEFEVSSGNQVTNCESSEKMYY